MEFALITGGMGFIGSYIARHVLREKLVDKVVLVDHWGGYISPINNTIVDQRKHRIAGIEDKVVIERAQVHHLILTHQLLCKYKPKYIFHLAGLPLASIENSSAEEAMEGSVNSTNNLLQSIQLLKDQVGYEPERFVYASSSMVYGDFQYTPADELHPLNPRNIYGVMKLAGETCTLGLARSFKLKAACIRPSAVYGPTDMNQRVTQIFLDNAMLGKKLIVEGEDVALDFTFVEDIAEGFGLAATNDKAIGEVFNVTAGQAYKLLDYIKILKEYFPDLDCEVRERDGSRPKRGTLSIEKANRMIGYSPRHTLRQGLEKYISFKKENRVTL